MVSRPLESFLHGCVDSLLSLFGYPPGLVTALANGVLGLGYCSDPFARRFSNMVLGSGTGAVRLFMSDSWLLVSG